MPSLLRGRSIRTYLVLLVIATVLPLLGFVSAILVINARLQREATEARLVEVARVLAFAVDRDLRVAEAALRVLAASPALARGDVAGFFEPAAEVGRRHGGFVVLIDRHNQEVLNTGRAYGIPLPHAGAPDEVDFVMQTGASYVSDVYTGAVQNRPLVSIAVPVRHNGVRFVLDMGFFPERFAELLDVPQRESSWTAALLDRKGVVIAARPDRGFVARQASDEIVEAIHREREGWTRSTMFGERHAYGAFARVPNADWTVVIAIPSRAAYADVERALYPILAGAALALAVGLLLASVFGRRIAAPLARLAAAARHPETLEDFRGASGIAEVQDLEAAVVDGQLSHAREHREHERRLAEETRRGVAEEALAAVAGSEARWRALFEQASEAIVITDAAGVCRDANPAACRLIGYGRDELVGRPVVNFAVPEDIPRIAPALRSFLAAGVHTDEWTLAGRERRVPVEVNARVLADGRWQVFVRDVTERREIERERARVLDAERAARAEAEAANRTKDDFLANLSHELRTPLNSISGWCKILRSGRLDAAETTRALDVIDRAVQAQTMLVRDLLDVSRIIRGELKLDVHKTDLSEIVTEACEALRPSAEVSEVTFGCTAEPGIIGSCDADRMQQVVWNLVTNALKFTPSGGRVDVRLERVDPEHARLTVADTGRGIAPEFLPRLFERFQQFDVGGRARTRGIGIGLAIVKHIVEAHGGTVTAESPGPGRGATFTVLLPIDGAFVPS